MARKHPKLAIARFRRICPVCGELINIGEPIANQRSRFAWVHPGCYINPKLKKADAQLKGIG